MIPGKHDQLGIANKTRRQPITTTLGKLYVVALFISPSHQGHVFLLHTLHSVRLTIVSHQNLLNVGLAVEYLSYGLYKSNTMLKHCGGSPKWLEAQNLQGTLLNGYSMPLDSLTIGKSTSGGWSAF